MKFLSLILKYLKNKYFLATSCFIVWMLCFDHNDLFTQIQRQYELKELKQSEEYLKHQISDNRKFSNDLEYNASAIEKYAREKYLMKRENEDLFLIRPLKNK